MANILVHFRKIDPDVLAKNALKEFKRDSNLIGNIDVVIADLGFAK
jgi:hypothetical protein